MKKRRDEGMEGGGCSFYTECRITGMPHGGSSFQRWCVGSARNGVWGVAEMVCGVCRGWDVESRTCIHTP